MRRRLKDEYVEFLTFASVEGVVLSENIHTFEWYLIQTVKKQAKELEQFKQYYDYFASDSYSEPKDVKCIDEKFATYIKEI